jgi:hypothetical protein
MDQGGLLQILRTVERDGIRCGAPVLLAGFVAGAGLAEVAAGPLGLASRTICELVILLVLQVAGPVLIVLLALVQLGPLWLEHVQEQGLRTWRVAVPAGAGSGLATPAGSAPVRVWRTPLRATSAATRVGRFCRVRTRPTGVRRDRVACHAAEVSFASAGRTMLRPGTARSDQRCSTG